MLIAYECDVILLEFGMGCRIDQSSMQKELLEYLGKPAKDITKHVVFEV